MTVITLIEILHIIIAILSVGYIFTGLLNLKFNKKDVLDAYVKRFDWREFWFVCMAASPGIILHEMAHKFVAMGFGLQAFFQVSYFGLILGVIMKLLSTGFIFLAPGYVIISGANEVQSMLTALAGPVINLLLWLLAMMVLKYKETFSRKQAVFWNLTLNINKWLFIFNILPIPPLDGFKVWIPLFKMIF